MRPSHRGQQMPQMPLQPGRTVALLVGIALMVSACQPCGNEITEIHNSPDGELEVVVFQRSCGITTPFSTQLTVQEAGKGLPSGPGNIFMIVQTDSSLRSPPGPPAVSVSWIGNRELHIRHDPRDDVRLAVSRLGSLAISTEAELEGGSPIDSPVPYED
jgi:hypothetical protein